MESEKLSSLPEVTQLLPGERRRFKCRQTDSIGHYLNHTALRSRPRRREGKPPSSYHQENKKGNGIEEQLNRAKAKIRCLMGSDVNCRSKLIYYFLTL